MSSQPQELLQCQEVGIVRDSVSIIRSLAGGANYALDLG